MKKFQNLFPLFYLITQSIDKIVILLGKKCHFHINININLKLYVYNSNVCSWLVSSIFKKKLVDPSYGQPKKGDFAEKQSIVFLQFYFIFSFLKTWNNQKNVLHHSIFTRCSWWWWVILIYIHTSGEKKFKKFVWKLKKTIFHHHRFDGLLAVWKSIWVWFLSQFLFLIYQWW